MTAEYLGIVSAVSGLLGIVIGAFLQAFLARWMESHRRKVKKLDVCNLIAAELLNLKRHAEVSVDKARKAMRTVDFEKMKYRGDNFIGIDIKQTYYLDRNLCQDIMDVCLGSRNNDIELDHIIKKLTPNSDDDAWNDSRRIASKRMAETSEIAGDILDRIDDYIRNLEK